MHRGLGIVLGKVSAAEVLGTAAGGPVGAAEASR